MGETNWQLLEIDHCLSYQFIYQYVIHMLDYILQWVSWELHSVHAVYSSGHHTCTSTHLFSSGVACTHFTYYCTCACGVCAGKMYDIVTVWRKRSWLIGRDTQVHAYMHDSRHMYMYMEVVINSKLVQYLSSSNVIDEILSFNVVS